MAKLIPMREAAQMLGVSIEELNNLRSSNKIFGYRDGSSWKFKESELQRVSSELGAQRSSPDSDAPGSPADEEDFGFDDDLEELVDVSELGELEEPAGEQQPKQEKKAGNSKVQPAAEQDEHQELQLASDDSDVLEVGDSGAEKQSDTASLEEPGADAREDLGADADELKLAPDDEDDESELSPVSSAAESSSETGDSTDQPADEDEFSLADGELDLAAESEDDFVLGSADDESEINLGGDDELSLDEAPTELASSSSADDLDLGDEDVLSLREDEAESSAETVELKADDDFLLTPIDEGEGEESGSGSQVIPLDTDDFEESAESMVIEGEEETFLEEETDLGALPEGADTEMPLGAGAPLAGQAQATETQYSVWNVLGLSLIVLVLLPTGLMMVDLMRHMWSWNEPYTLNSSLMDTILSMFGG